MSKYEVQSFLGVNIHNKLEVALRIVPLKIDKFKMMHITFSIAYDIEVLITFKLKANNSLSTTPFGGHVV